ncbi:sensor histidine kinase [Clostridium butyricum]|uniref:sensor histidine kinase n=1 Tax=Clostridium butyricum TaxID=1492 RepID=UPI0002C8E002|nr:sensor histidine kinase [Clostridium butyricum]EMU52158.1 hypothetical protein CBDKU1_39220 [Clostridium butyricum DKU-01]
MEKKNLETHIIRPSARIITSIGSEIIKDPYAALLELIKNAYDADSPTVKIEFTTVHNSIQDGDNIKIIITDKGHGMSRDVILNKWMVPATSDKLIRKQSPKGRILQGRKGIGRYSASILGNKLELTTVDNNGMKTIVNVNWDDFNSSEYLDDIEISVSTMQTTEKSGTQIIIIGAKNYLTDWTDKSLDKLVKELQKLVSPINVKIDDGEKLKSPVSDKSKEEFEITLSFNNFPSERYNNVSIKIEPFPVLELYDYRLHGSVDGTGLAQFTFENKTQLGLPSVSNNVQIKLNPLENERYCGEIEFDFRVFDREPDAITNLINKGLTDGLTGSSLGKEGTRRLLDDISGIRIYREGFRIRPYGEPGYDWLNLNFRRIQNPSLRISTNQIHGTVLISSEEESNLIEKSSREGLKENDNFNGLLEILRALLNELEQRRYSYRKRTGKSRKPKNINEELDNLFDLDNLSSDINNIILNEISSKDKIDKINKVIMDVKKEKAKQLNEIKETIALYQGQATLGKIVMILLHEGRKPLSWFRDLPKVLSFKVKKFFESPTEGLFDDVIDTTKFNSIVLNKLFDRIEPLAIKKRGSAKNFKLIEAINKSSEIYSEQMKKDNITIDIDCSNELIVYGWIADFYVAFTNLIENSIYWLNNSSNNDKKISITAYLQKENFIVSYKDNGVGISLENIESEAIFDPNFTTKPDGGSGLGLSLAGEAIKRNNGILKAIYDEAGANFLIEINTKAKVED